MLDIFNNNIKLTRGDTCYLELVIWMQNDKGQSEIYELQKGDKVVFSLRNKPQKIKNTLIFSKEFKSRIIKLDPIDTQFLKDGNYFYDCVVTLSNGDVNTISDGTFKLIN